MEIIHPFLFPFVDEAVLEKGGNLLASQRKHSD